MAHYFFHLRDGSEAARDAEGVDLPDDAAAIDYARIVLCELMRNCEPQTRHWLLDLTGENGQKVSELRFAAFDKTLNHFSARSRALIEQLYATRLAWLETTARSRLLLQQSRALLGQSRGRPYLCTDRWGERVL